MVPERSSKTEGILQGQRVVVLWNRVMKLIFFPLEYWLDGDDMSIEMIIDKRPMITKLWSLKTVLMRSSM